MKQLYASKIEQGIGVYPTFTCGYSPDRRGFSIVHAAPTVSLFGRRFRRQFGDVLSRRLLCLRIAAVELVGQQMFRPQHQRDQNNQQRIHFPAGAIEVHVAFNFVAAARQAEFAFAQ